MRQSRPRDSNKKRVLNNKDFASVANKIERRMSSVLIPAYKVPPPAVEVYAEDTAQHEINDGDIEKFAKLIGIDVEKEPHLRYIAEEGLLAPLPKGWKPCREPVKNQWYYYNSGTKLSQWEHPLDQAYRQKVLQVREEMNRTHALELDPITSRPIAKGLPPVRKFGAGGRPPTAAGRLGPIGGAPPPNRLNDDLSLKMSESLSALNKELDDYDKDHDEDLPLPSSRMVKKPLQASGLLLTGEGANFVKSKVPSKGMTKNATSSTTTTTDFIPAPVKSILSQNGGKDAEKKYFDDLNIPFKDKPGVKFQLDENTEFHFDPVESEASESHDSPHNRVHIGPMNKPNVAKKDAYEEEFGETEESSHNSSPRDHGKNLEYKLSSTLDGGGAGEKIQPTLQARKETLSQNMEGELKKFQEKLEKERKQRELQIQKHTEMSLEEFRNEKDSLIKKTRQDLENHKNIELDKVKREFEQMVKVEVDKLKIMYDKELENKKTELKSQHDMAMSVISLDGEFLSDTPQSEGFKQQLAETSAKLNAELKERKHALREDQRKQIQQMKDYHQTFIEKLKKDLHSEELRIQAEHKQRIFEVTEKFAQETVDLQMKLKAEQESKMKALRTDFEREKVAVEQELKAGLSSLRNELNKLKSGANIKSNPPVTPTRTPSKASKDTEVKELNEKYEQLEKKYSTLKKELRKLADAAAIKVQKDPKNTQSNKSRPASRNRMSEELEKPGKPRKQSTPRSIEPEFLPSETVTASASVSESESTFYPASYNNNNIERHFVGGQDEEDYEERSNSPMNDMLEENNDRLACALRSLETLKLQILEIQRSRPNTSTSRPATPVPIPKSSKTKKSLAPGPIPSANNSFSAKIVPKPAAIKNQIQKRGNGNASMMPSTRISSSRKLRPSKSASELPGLIEAGDSEDLRDSPSPSPRAIVKEAKEFIRTQKERLNVQGPHQSPASARPMYNPHNYQEQQFIGYRPKTSVPTRFVEGLYSETESSGVGSMSFVNGGGGNKDLKSNQKKKISKDIEAICSSLTHLDEQMKMMWTVVNSNHKIPNASTMAMNPQSQIMQSFTGSTFPLQQRNNKNNFPVAPFAPLASTARLTPSNLLNSLDKELQEFKATKERILSQFSSPKNNKNSNDLAMGSGGDSIQDKTKDLREWLEKF